MPLGDRIRDLPAWRLGRTGTNRDDVLTVIAGGQVASVREGESVGGDLTKAERKQIRRLAGIAWERELRDELRKIATAIHEMENDTLTPFDVNDSIHRFHNGASRDLYRQYSDSLPWLGVCRAYIDRVLSDDDLLNTSDEVRNGIREFAASFAKLDAEEGITGEYGREGL